MTDLEATELASLESTSSAPEAQAGSLAELLACDRREGQACPLCGVTARSKVGETSGYDILQCQRCRHCYIPDPAAAATNLRKKSPGLFDYPEMLADVLELTRTARGREVSDFGCGQGAIAHALKHEHRVTAYDFVEPDDSSGFEFLKLDVTRESFSDYEFGYLVHTLEHVMDPMLLLQRLRSRMAASGALYVEVPASEFIGDARVVNKKIIAPAHVQYFTTRSAKLLAELCGFAVKDHGSVVTEGIPRVRLTLTHADERGFAGALLADTGC